MSEFHKIFSFLKNTISLYLTLKRINVKVAVIMGGNHLAMWEFSCSNEIRIKLIYLWCEQQCTGVGELCHQEIWRWLCFSISSWHKLPVLIANLLSEPKKMNFSNSRTICLYYETGRLAGKNTLVYSRHHHFWESLKNSQDVSCHYPLLSIIYTYIYGYRLLFTNNFWKCQAL